MKRIRKVVMSIISCVLAFSIFCISASAAEVVMGITDEITRNNEFPLDVTISSISEDKKDVSLIISVKTAFSVYQNVSLRITELQSDEVMYSDLYKSANTISISGLSTADTYCIYLMMYTGSDNREYEAILSFESNDAVELKLNYTELVNNVTDASKKQQEEKNSEVSKELYESMFNNLEIPSFIDEDIAREAGHILQMEEFDNNKNIIGYENSDGTKTVYLFSSPVKYEDAEGKLHNAVPKIVKAEVTAQKNGYGFMNDYGKVKTYYSDSITNTNAVKVQNEDIEFEFGFSIPKQDDSLWGKITTTVSNFFVGDSNKAELSTSNKQQVLQYNKINDGNMQIVAEPTISGAKQTLILKSAPQSNKISFWVKNNNYSARQAESNASVEFYNGEKSAYSIGNVEIRDSFDGEDASGAIHFSVNNTLKILESTNTQTLVEVSLDEEMINSPITSYPVAISLYATTSATTVDYTYFEDRMVYNNGTSVSASSPYLIVGKNGTYSETDYYEYYNETTCQYEIVEYTTTHNREGIAFMKYDLCAFSGLNPSNIQSANLILHEGSGNSGGVQIDLKRVTTNWSENNVTSNYINYVDNYYAGNSCLYMSTSSSGLEHSFDITQMTTEHLISDLGLSGGITNYGFQLRSYASAPGKHFYSSEHSTIAYRPKLVLTYSDPQTPDDLGLNTNKAYWIKNKDSGQYLTVMQNQWKSGSNVGVTNSSLDPFSNSISALQKSNMYWQIEYIGNGEYRLIPFNTRDMRLDVISSSNTNGANVGIYSNDGYDSSIWRIKKNGTNNFSILSKTSYYSKGLRVTGTNVDIYNSSNDTNWEFIEVRCSGITTNQVDKFADGNALIPFSHSSGYTRYRCANCNHEFMSPEEQDKSILSNREYITMIGLQKAYVEKVIENDLAKADATVRVMNHIRQKFGGNQYDFRNESGVFKSDYNYYYTDYDFYINVQTDDRTDAIFGSQMLDLMSFIPGPYGLLCSGLSLIEDWIESGSISYIDAIFLVANGADELLKIFNVTKFEKARDIINNVGTAWGAAQLLTNNNVSYQNNYTVSIEYTNNSETKFVYGEYRFNYKDSIYIKQEKLTEGSGNVNAHYNYGKFSYNVISTSGNYYWMDLVTGSYVPNGFQ